MSPLPEALSNAVERSLAGIRPDALARAATLLSERYRAGAGNAAGRDEILAYLATRLPATYAAAHAAFEALALRLPDLRPASLLDLGAGPGTASWAALDVFPTLADVTLVEREPLFRREGQALARDAPAPLAAAYWVAADLAAAALPPADLVVASFALAEIAPQHQPRLIAAAWQASRQALVLIEPGTPSGFARIAVARAQLLDAGAEAAAPCPHRLPCPLIGTAEWCHRSVRLARSRTHRAAKGAELGWEDEKFSYLAVTRHPVATAGSRLLYPPRIGKAEIQAFLCRKDGTAAWRRIPARDRASYKAARKWRWGDAIHDTEP